MELLQNKLKTMVEHKTYYEHGNLVYSITLRKRCYYVKFYDGNHLTRSLRFPEIVKKDMIPLILTKLKCPTNLPSEGGNAEEWKTFYNNYHNFVDTQEAISFKPLNKSVDWNVEITLLKRNERFQNVYNGESADRWKIVFNTINREGYYCRIFLKSKFREYANSIILSSIRQLTMPTYSNSNKEEWKEFCTQIQKQAEIEQRDFYLY